MAWRMVMVTVMVGAGLAGCERHDTTATYDPRIDGVAPMQYSSATPHILEDQNKLERIKVTDSGRINPGGGGGVTGGGGATTGPESPATPPLPPDAGPAIPPPPDAE